MQVGHVTKIKFPFGFSFTATIETPLSLEEVKSIAKETTRASKIMNLDKSAVLLRSFNVGVISPFWGIWEIAISQSDSSRYKFEFVFRDALFYKFFCILAPALWLVLYMLANEIKAGKFFFYALPLSLCLHLFFSGLIFLSRVLTKKRIVSQLMQFKGFK